MIPRSSPILLAAPLLAALWAGPLAALGTEGAAPLPVRAEAGALGAARVGAAPIVAGDVLRLRVGTWDLVGNQYQEWTGVDGELAVQDDGTILVPFAGAVRAAGRAPGAIAEEISVALRAATGVQAPPAVVVEVTGRRPVYVSGDVTTPGAIEFRPGLTVRQAIALAGGPLRLVPGADLLGRQVQLREAILRADLRIARLEAELDGAADFEAPEGLEGQAELERLVAVERRLMEARGAALAAQTASMDDLLAVLVRVKAGLEDQIALVEGDLGRAQEELERRQELLERGLAREMDVAGAETSLSNLRLRLVEMNTQYLTLEKDLSEARRGRDTLGQTREVEILQELSAVRDQRRDLELEAALLVPGLAAAGSGEPAPQVLLIEAGGRAQVPVEPEAELRPGDTLILETQAP